MNEDSVERLKKVAKHLNKFRDLDESEQDWLIELLKHGRLVLSALNVLNAISEEALSFEEISEKTGLHPNTIKQILGAISEDCAVDEQQTEKFISRYGGRPRKLKQYREER